MLEMRYEGYGPAGVAVLVDCLSDNKNRTVSEVRHAFSKCGGNLGTDGSVAYLFAKQGQICFSAGVNEELIFDIALEAGADDVISGDDGSIDVLTAPENFHQVLSSLEDKSLNAERAEVTMQASTIVPLDVEGAEKLMRLVDLLEDLDDVQNVYTNAEIPDDVLENLSE